MYNAITMTLNPPSKITESFSIGVGSNQPELDDRMDPSIFTEAVFSKGKESIKPIEDQISVIKNILMSEIGEQEKSEAEAAKAREEEDDDDNKPKKQVNIKSFDPKKFWRSPEFKKLEELYQKTFGFRSVQIMPYIEKYISKDKEFESKSIQCFTYTMDRYPIDGLVTDQGFFDKTHSISLEIRISLGIIRMLDAGELTGVILHEIGHNIDPALVTINYAETNILSKYLTERKNELTNTEKKLESSKHSISEMLILPILAGLMVVVGIISSIVNAIKSIFTKNSRVKDDEQAFEKLKAAIAKDAKNSFNRKDYGEAFADNFARMYGYGAQLSGGLKKMAKHYDDSLKSRFSREADRQKCIIYVVTNTLKDEHKTEIHRVKALIAAYYEDINNPNTPVRVKRQLREDVKEVEAILDSYMHDFSEFQNRINKIINDEIDKAQGVPKEDNPPAKKDAAKDKDKPREEKKGEPIKESTEFFESKKTKKPLTPAERAEVKKRFGNEPGCSFAKDKDGYFCYTHRCRSDSYSSIKDIPEEKYKFVCSTS